MFRWRQFCVVFWCCCRLFASTDYPKCDSMRRILFQSGIAATAKTNARCTYCLIGGVETGSVYQLRGASGLATVGREPNNGQGRRALGDNRPHSQALTLAIQPGDVGPESVSMIQS